MKKITFSPPDISTLEIEEVVNALKSGWITTGPKTKLLENQIANYIGVNKSVCLNSATAALELALIFFGVGPGDEVITSVYTYSASAAVIEHVGAKIILIDIQPDTLEMDYAQLENAITCRTKAIIPVDIAGIICDYDSIFSIVERKKKLFNPTNKIQSSLGRILVLADAAHSFGATRNGIKSGNFADFSCFSFHAVKNLTTAEGGALVWSNSFNMNDSDIYNKFMLLSLHGQNKDALSKSKLGAWEYDIIYLGHKCNMTDIHAAIGLAQLSRYPSLLEKRNEIYTLYIEKLSSPDFDVLIHKSHYYCSSMHLMLVNIKGISEEDRNIVISNMAEYGIATNVHYKPLAMFTAYKNLGFKIEDYPNAFNRYENIISLPFHTLLTKEDVSFICETLALIVAKLKRDQKYDIKY